eukprot:TRINITY_DN585_c1_g2_i10.p1 TRINITY_DN585_c1_g2~~TRINITY_DN585_c1_g2_i10.p1  ORF type:complete len:236 (+),score=54.24 TRINITY_DN585_c1_g2_i10:51-758(+)
MGRGGCAAQPQAGSCSAAIPAALVGYAREIDALALKGDALAADAARTVFDLRPGAVPRRTTEAFLAHWRKVIACSDASFVLSRVYLDRCGVALTSRNKHLLLLTALVLAAKFQDDEFDTNAHYGQAGGVTLRLMNTLEEAFLAACEWDFYVAPSLFESTAQRLLAAAPRAPRGRPAAAPAPPLADDGAASCLDALRCFLSTLATDLASLGICGLGADETATTHTADQEGSAIPSL